jgi:hypothetical protein
MSVDFRMLRRIRYSANGCCPAYGDHVSVTTPAVSSRTAVNVTGGVNSGSIGLARRRRQLRVHRVGPASVVASSQPHDHPETDAHGGVKGTACGPVCHGAAPLRSRFQEPGKDGAQNSVLQGPCRAQQSVGHRP